ncbi:MAG TPA: type II secretion system protein, partial [Thermoanaerobaculia bacterium]|nr:type II secretion system protein [Thermoanaerobaculia bacterium]
MRTRERGMTLAEAVVAIGIVGVIIAMSTTMLTTVYRGTQDNINKQFATQKAVSMLEELRGLIQTQDGGSANVLDDYDNGTTNSTILTTQRTVSAADDPASGNTRLGDKWLYERRVTVQKVKGANDLRLVNVKVFINEASGQRQLAEVASVLTTIGQDMPPTQVYDIYLIAIENVPGWWLYMQNVVPFVDSAMQDLESRHPGLVFRKHWIRKLSYGRDPLYTPYINRNSDSNSRIDSVYFYPGTMPTGSAVETYYPPDFFNARVKIDTDIQNDFDETENPIPYALADQYNNGMRYPDELTTFQARVAAGLEDPTAPTFRLLLDDMYMHPSDYRNAIIINLHGELFPFPPVRNYSDAAKDPSRWPYVRAVTHPEKLVYSNGDPVKLRVYAYHTRPSNPGSIPDWLGKGAGLTPITITLKDIQWTPLAPAIQSVSGGVDQNNDTKPDNYAFQQASITPSGTSAPASMWWTSRVDGNDTIISLYNTPLKAPCVSAPNPCDKGGLSNTFKLYGLEYIPSPVENLPSGAAPQPFQTNLASAGDFAKNTARWVITIPVDVLRNDRILTFETRIGADVTTGVLFPESNGPLNLSRTYAWRGTDLWVYGDATNDPNLPITEHFQLLGDPRHCPYSDVKSPHLGSGRARENAVGMGYNRYFDDFHSAATNAAASWPGFAYDAPAGSGTWYGIKNNTSDTTNNNDGWDSRSGLLEIDVSRIYQVLRSVVTRTHAVYTTMTGFSYYYVGIGGEIGYDDANQFPNSIPVSSRPFDGSNGTRFEQSITDANINSQTGGVKYIRENENVANYWWSMSWLGELFPDSAWTQWRDNGNLATGTGAGNFIRVLRGSINSNLPAGTVLLNTVRRPQEEGSAAFFWAGNKNSTFHHRYQDGSTGALDTAGTAIKNTYKVPLADSISNNRPFDITVDDTAMNPDHFLQSVYGPATTLRKEAFFYKHSTNIPGSNLLSMKNGNDTAFVVVNGLSPVGDSGIAFISRWSFLSLVQSFFESGLYSNGGKLDPSRVREVPRITITSPNDQLDINDPSTLRITWSMEWKRWDGLSYTPGYAANFVEDTTVRYATIYSRDNGRTWLHMKDDALAIPGVRPT